MLAKVDIWTGGVAYLLSSVVFFSGFVAGLYCIPPAVPGANADRSVFQALFHWDAGHYRQIATHGYTYTPGRASDVAFFPLYPLTAAALAGGLALSVSAALLVVASGCHAASFVLLHAYVRVRFPGQKAMPAACLAAFALYAPTLFFHVPYSEALFVCLSLLTLLAVQHRLPLGLLAVLIGAATATRPVGVCLLALLFAASARRGGSRWRQWGRGACYVPLGVAGLLGFILWQYKVFGEPWAFLKTQDYWRTQYPVVWPDKLVALLVGEPVWGAFDPASPFYWQRFEHFVPPTLSLIVFNPVAFVGALALWWLGWHARLLTPAELILSALLLGVPYLTKGYDNSMFSMARFTIVVVPLYSVAGKLLLGAPRWLGVLAALLSGAQFLAFTALFAAGYLVF